MDSAASMYVDAPITSSKEKSTKRLKPQALQQKPYSPWENIVRPNPMLFRDFTALPLEIIRNKYAFKPSVLDSLITCPTTTAPETAQQASCNDIWGDSLVTKWRSRKVKDLCEESGLSKIHCYDSIGKSRFCVFENAMMSFKKVRKRKQDGSITRSWERGFLAADCGDMGKDDIGYLPLYKPDIEREHGEDPRCDFVFNETVLAYSHENIRNFGQIVSDYLNVWSMVWIAGISQEMRDISFLNIDSIRKGKFFNDVPNHFFKTYDVAFRRIIKAADFAETGARVCFKRLLMQPRPALKFTYDGGAQDELKCSDLGPSSLFQRWNLQVRNFYGLLPGGGSSSSSNNNPISNNLFSVADLPTNRRTQVLLVVRSDRPGVTEHITSRLFSNTDDIVNALLQYIKASSSSSVASTTFGNIELVVSDIVKLTFEEQVRLIANSSVIIGMHGSGIANSIHMPVGTTHCCGVIEIFPGEFQSIKGYGGTVRRMGHVYERLEIASNHTSPMGTAVSPDTVVEKLKGVLQSIRTKPSCFLQSVVSAPFLLS